MMNGFSVSAAIAKSLAGYFSGQLINIVPTSTIIKAKSEIDRYLISLSNLIILGRE